MLHTHTHICGKSTERRLFRWRRETNRRRRDGRRQQAWEIRARYKICMYEDVIMKPVILGES